MPAAVQFYPPAQPSPWRDAFGRPFAALAAASLALTIWRIVALHVTHYPLFFDEAQYHYWSLYPAFGYYSKPPMTAWIITLTSSLCGHGESCIRSASPVLHMATAFVLYGAGFRLFKDAKTAATAALVYLCAPAAAVSSMLITTDAPLLFFFSAALFFFAGAVERPRNVREWLACGACGGLAMLSKYNAAWFAVGALWYALTPQRRFLLKTPGFWLAGLAAAAVFAPNVIWNARNGFVSFLHTRDNAAPGFWAEGISPFLEFFGAQFGVFGPVMFPLLLAALLLKRENRGDDENLLARQVWPGLICAGLVALSSRAHANWAAPAYTAGALLTARWCLRNKHTAWLAVGLAVNLGACLTVPYGRELARTAGWTPAAATSIDKKEIRDPYARLTEGRELGALAGAAYAFAPEGTVMFTDERAAYALLSYYTDIPHEKLRKWNPEGRVKDHFDMTASSLEGISLKGPFLFLTRSEQFDLDRYAEKHTLKQSFTVGPYPEKKKRYYLYELEGLKQRQD